MCVCVFSGVQFWTGEHHRIQRADWLLRHLQATARKNWKWGRWSYRGWRAEGNKYIGVLFASAQKYAFIIDYRKLIYTDYCPPSGLFPSVSSARWPQCRCSSTPVPRAPRQWAPGVPGQGVRDPGHRPAAQRQQWQSESSSASQQFLLLQPTA